MLSRLLLALQGAVIVEVPQCGGRQAQSTWALQILTSFCEAGRCRACNDCAFSLQQFERNHRLLWHAGLKAFFTTPQLSVKDKVANSLALGTSPIVRALIDPEGGMRDIRSLDNISFADWFKRHGGSQGSIDRMWDPIGAVFRR